MKPVLRLLFWLVVAASLLLNAVVFGLWLRLGGLRDDAGSGLADLPRAARLEFRRALAERRADLDARLTALRETRRAMFAAGAARPYDRAAVEAAMERVRAATGALQEEGQKVLLRAFDRAAESP